MAKKSKIVREQKLIRNVKKYASLRAELKSIIKSPKSSFDTAITTSSEILKRIPDLPAFMDRADYALKLMSEGKLNLSIGTNKKLELEQMKIKNFRNNIVISFFGVVIVYLLVF